MTRYSRLFVSRGMPNHAVRGTTACLWFGKNMKSLIWAAGRDGQRWAGAIALVIPCAFKFRVIACAA